MKAPASEWVRVENADRYGRGGLLPMAVFLTKNSPGLRTSPVKRGYWVVRRVLGEHIPPPPPTVPELPKDESKLGDRTLRQALEQHRANPACAGCHARFDSYRPGLRRVWADRRAAQQGSGRKAGGYARAPSPAAGAHRAWRACRSSSASSARTIFWTTSAASCCPMPWDAACSPRTTRMLHRCSSDWPRRLPLREPGGDDCHQPAVPHPARARPTIARN